MRIRISLLFSHLNSWRLAFEKRVFLCFCSDSKNKRSVPFWSILVSLGISVFDSLMFIYWKNFARGMLLVQD